MDQGTVNPKMKLEDQGITGLGYVYYNRSEAELQDAAVAAGEGVTGKGGAFLVTTGVRVKISMSLHALHQGLLNVSVVPKKARQLLLSIPQSRHC